MVGQVEQNLNNNNEHTLSEGPDGDFKPESQEPKAFSSQYNSLADVIAAYGPKGDGWEIDFLSSGENILRRGPIHEWQYAESGKLVSLSTSVKGKEGEDRHSQVLENLYSQGWAVLEYDNAFTGKRVCEIYFANAKGHIEFQTYNFELKYFQDQNFPDGLNNLLDDYDADDDTPLPSVKKQESVILHLFAPEKNHQNKIIEKSSAWDSFWQSLIKPNEGLKAQPNKQADLLSLFGFGEQEKNSQSRHQHEGQKISEANFINLFLPESAPENLAIVKTVKTEAYKKPSDQNSGREGRFTPTITPQPKAKEELPVIRLVKTAASETKEQGIADYTADELPLDAPKNRVPANKVRTRDIIGSRGIIKPQQAAVLNRFEAKNTVKAPEAKPALILRAKTGPLNPKKQPSPIKQNPPDKKIITILAQEPIKIVDVNKTDVEQEPADQHQQPDNKASGPEIAPQDKKTAAPEAKLKREPEQPIVIRPPAAAEITRVMTEAAADAIDAIDTPIQVPGIAEYLPQPVETKNEHSFDPKVLAFAKNLKPEVVLRIPEAALITIQEAVPQTQEIAAAVKADWEPIKIAGTDFVDNDIKKAEEAATEIVNALKSEDESPVKEPSIITITTTKNTSDIRISEGLLKTPTQIIENSGHLPSAIKIEAFPIGTTESVGYLPGVMEKTNTAAKINIPVKKAVPAINKDKAKDQNYAGLSQPRYELFTESEPEETTVVQTGGQKAIKQELKTMQIEEAFYRTPAQMPIKAEIRAGMEKVDINLAETFKILSNMTGRQEKIIPAPVKYTAKPRLERQIRKSLAFEKQNASEPAGQLSQNNARRNFRQAPVPSPETLRTIYQSLTKISAPDNPVKTEIRAGENPKNYDRPIVKPENKITAVKNTGPAAVTALKALSKLQKPAVVKTPPAPRLEAENLSFKTENFGKDKRLAPDTTETSYNPAAGIAGAVNSRKFDIITSRSLGYASNTQQSAATDSPNISKTADTIITLAA